MRRLLGLALLLTVALGLGSTSAGQVAASALPLASSARSFAGLGDGMPFTIAVIPDTQEEVFAGDTRLAGRTQWLLDNQQALDLRFVAQVGDVTSWGWLDPAQLTRASNAFRPFEKAGLAYSLAVGNHDTRTVGWNGHGGYGGSAYVENPECLQRFSKAECKTDVLLRRTAEINRVFTASRFGKVRGAFETGKIDNLYSTFHAGGLDWLVLDLEIWPRASALAWATRVVEEHPTYNVIINTHSYLTSSNDILDHNDNGDAAPIEVWRKLVSQYPNVVMVLCGHVGRAGMRLDRGVAGNRIVSFRQTFPHVDEQTNAVRLVTIDPSAGSVTSRMYSPQNGESFPAQNATYKGFDFVSGS